MGRRGYHVFTEDHELVYGMFLERSEAQQFVEDMVYDDLALGYEPQRYTIERCQPPVDGTCDVCQNVRVRMVV